jgi:hypothetical protein
MTVKLMDTDLLKIISNCDAKVVFIKFILFTDINQNHDDVVKSQKFSFFCAVIL